MSDMTDTAAPLFNLSTVFQGIAEAIPDVPLLTWRGRHHTYREVDVRADGIAHYLTSVGMGCQRERSELQNHESGQDHLALYLLNGNEYIEAMIGAYRARVAPFNCSYRYVEAELIHMLTDSRATGIVYHARFAPVLASVRDQLPDLRVLIQVADESGNDLLPGAVDYESIVTTPAPGAQRAGRLDTEPATGMPTPSGEDLYLLYTGGTTGMPKGVMWRQHDIFVSSMGGRPFGSETAYPSIDAIADVARAAAGNIASMLLAPLIHGAAQWALFNIMTMGGRIIMPDTVDTLRPDEVLRLVEAEKVFNLPVVGDAMARPLIDEIERGDYDLSSLSMVSNGGANVSHGVRERFRAAIPGVLILNVLGSSEGGLQMTAAADTSTLPFALPYRFGPSYLLFDRIGLLDGELFASVIAKHPQVARVICGHHHRVDLVVGRRQDLLHVALGVGGQPAVGIGLADDGDVTRVERLLQYLLLAAAQEVGVGIGGRPLDHHVVALRCLFEHGGGLHPADLDIVEGQIEGARILDQPVIADDGDAFVRRGLDGRADGRAVLGEDDERVGAARDQALDVGQLLGRRTLRVGGDVFGTRRFERGLDRRLVGFPALFLEVGPADADRQILGHGGAREARGQHGGGQD